MPLNIHVDVDQWGWSRGFYPRSHRLEHHDGTAETFEQARAVFEAAWRDYLPGCTEADFTEYRRQRAWSPRPFLTLNRSRSNSPYIPRLQV